MEWNGKIPLQWDWENLIMFNTTTAENPRKLRQTEWDIDGDGEFDSTSFFSSGGCGGSSGGSGSVLGGFPSLSKSSKSASNNSSSVGETKTSKINFEALGEIPEGFGTKKELISNSPTLESVGSAEPFLGLKLGKRMYFEDVCGGSGAKSSSFSVNPPSSSVTTAKRSKSSSQNTCAVRCQVEGCGLDLSSAKDYHRKHRVCESHSKSSKVLVGGLERRFCQQCSRFHGLSEFDEKKRSCRRRLSDHNARRRKPQPEAVRLNAARLSSSLYGGKQQLSLVWNNVPYLHTKPSENFIWEGTCGKPGKVGGTEGLLHSREGQLQNSVLSHCYDSNGFLLPKTKGTTTTKVIDQGEEGSMISFNLGAAQNDQRALSLLSTNFWGLGEPKQVSNSHAMDANQSNMPQPVIHSIPQVSPFASSEDWRTEKQSTDSQVQSLISHNHESNYAQEIRLSRASYESCFYSSHLN